MIGKKNLLLWIGGLVVVALVFIFVWQFGFITPKTSSIPESESKPFVTPTVYYVEGGAIPEGFPTGLILEKDAPYFVAFINLQSNSTAESLSTSTRNMMEQETVRWKSTMSLANLATAYESYFSKNGWIVKDKSESPSGKSQTILATKGTAEVRVSISSLIDGAQATVGYKVK